METLYRKYRPQNFDEVKGQEHIVKILKSQLKSGNISHAYIFIGPRGTGKTSVGRILAKAINCTNLKNGNPCGKCENCTMFQDGKSLDVVEIDAASNRSIDDIKNLKEKISFSPIKFNKKIYIIDEVHMLSKDAFNALLKTLEEPPSYVVFILATTEVSKVPLTVLSRCQRFDFKLASNDDLTGVLDMIIQSEKRKVSKEALILVSEMGKGSFRDSQTILQKLINDIEEKEEIDIDKAYKILGLTTFQNVKNLFTNLYNSDFDKSLEVLKDAITLGNSPTELCVQLIRFGEKALSIKGYDSDEVFKILDLLFLLERQLKITDYDDIAFELYVYKITNRNKGNNTNNPNNSSVNSDERKPFTDKSVDKDDKQDKTTKEDKKTTSKQDSSEEAIKENKEEEKDKIKESELNINTKENLEMLKKLWPDLIARVRAKNVPLSSLLSNAVILSVDGSVLNLRMRYKFHKSRIENKKALDIILSELEALAGRRMSIIAEVESEKDKLDLKGENDIVGDVFSELLQ